MAFYGRTPGLQDEHLGTSTNGARASVYGPMPEHGWAYRWRGRIGRAYASDQPQARGQFWQVTGGNPGPLVGSTNIWTVTTPGYSTGQITDVNQPLVEARQMFAGATYSVGFAGRTAQINYGINTAPAGQPTQTWTRSVADLGPHDPYGHTGTLWGQLAAAIEYMSNEKPNVPVQSGAVGTLHVSDPDFVGSFSDPNQLLPDDRANPNEKLKQYRIQLREGGADTLLVNGTYAASGAEQAANAFTFRYAGTLTPGIWYEWRCAVSDQFDAWSDWSGWTQFRVESGAMVANPGGVSGKITTTQPAGFALDYAHVEHRSAEVVQLELRQGGTPVRPTQERTVSWAPGRHTFDPVWGDPNGWDALSWGVDYNWRARVCDELGLWSDWTEPHAFWTNHRPGVPTNLRPVSGSASSSRPVLRFTMSDSDDEPPQLTAPVRLIDDATDTVLWTEPAHPAGGDKWELPLGQINLPDYGTYRWAARGDDGSLQSAWSAEATFVYAPGPVVEITAPEPDGIVTSATFTVAWTADDQVRFRVHAWHAGEAEPVYSSSWVTSAAREYEVVGTAWVRNGRSYDVAVEVENTATIRGTSQRARFTVKYPPAPSITGVQASAELAVGDRVPSIYRIGWEASTVPVGRFERYLVFRLDIDTYEAITGQGLSPIAEGAALMDVAVLVHESSSITETTATDDHPPSGVGWAYFVIQEVAEGIETVLSLPAAAMAEPLDLTSIVIADKDAGRTRRVVLDILAAANIQPVRRQAVLETWDHTGVPIIAESPVSYLVLTDGYRLYERDGVTPAAQLAMLQGLRQLRRDGSPTVVIYRDDLGRRVEGTITDVKIERRRLGRFDIEIELTGREV